MISLRPPAGRAYPGALRLLSAWREVRHAAAAPASRKSSGEGAGHGSTLRVPSPVFVLAAARYGSTPSYAAALIALARTNDRVSAVHGGVSPSIRRRSPNRPAATR